MVTNTTLTTELVETGEKRDRIGRKITPGPRRAELVAAWQASGLTQAEFGKRPTGVPLGADDWAR